MKKLVLGFVVLSFLFMGITANAEEKYVVGGFEASGHINTGFGFSYVGKDLPANALLSGVGLVRDGWSNFTNTPKGTDYGFLLDEVELDLIKTFGENIKFRADIDFVDPALGGRPAAEMVEQAYVTANIAAGNGIELLVGRFDAPIGFEAVDRNDNDTITRSAIFNYNLRPRTMTGAKFYYAFTDAVDLHFFVVNNFNDGVYVFDNNDSVPSFGTRLGYTWGEEGTENTVGLSVLGGSEVAKATPKKLGLFTYMGDLDWNIWFTDAFAVGGEALYRINAKDTAQTKTTVMAGLLNLHYVFSDVWDGTLKYALVRPDNGTSTIDAEFGTLVTSKAMLHEIGGAVGYQITDGAKFVAEYRLDWTKYTADATKNLSHAFLGNFAYSF